MNEDKALELYARYDCCRKVAEELGTSDESVRRVLVKHNVKRTGNRAKRQPKHRRQGNCDKKYCSAQVVMLRTVLGMRFGEIVDATKITPSAVNQVIRRYGLVADKPKTKADVEIQLVEREYLAGASTYELGEKYGVNHTTISRWMRELGHVRGKHHGPAYERSRRIQHEEAVARLTSNHEVEIEQLHGERPRAIVRKKRMNSRRRDSGINWRALAKRNDSMRCEICGIECDPSDKEWGTSGPTHPSVDHITRICDGGTDTWDNVRLACVACNLEANNEKRQEARHAEEQGAA